MPFWLLDSLPCCPKATDHCKGFLVFHEGPIGINGPPIPEAIPASLVLILVCLQQPALVLFTSILIAQRQDSRLWLYRSQGSLRRVHVLSANNQSRNVCLIWSKAAVTLRLGFYMKGSGTNPVSTTFFWRVDASGHNAWRPRFKARA